MANQFDVRVPNIYEAFLTGEQGYKEYANSRAMDDASNAIRTGDNRALMDALLRAKQIGPAIEMAKLDRQSAAGAEFSNDLKNIFTPQAQAGPAAAPSAPASYSTAPAQPSAIARMMNPEGMVAPARAEVASSPKVWGDKEGEAAGLYEPTGATASPVRVAQAQPQMQPQAQPQTRAAPQITPSPSLGGVSLDQAVPALLKAASNPSLAKEQQETARMLLGKAFDQYPQEVRQLEIFKQRPDLFAMAKELKNAGATVINTAEGQQAAETKARIDIDKHAVGDLSKKVASGRSALPLITQLMSINDKTPGGWTGAAAPYYAKMAATLGIDVPEGASNAELFSAISRRFVPSVRDPGATSNFEQSMYLQAVPNLSQSQEGRAKIAGMMKAMIERETEVLATYRKYIGRPELDQKLTELDNKPLFSPEDRKMLQVASGAQGGPGAQGGQGGQPQPRQAPDGKFYIPDPNRPGKYLMVQ